MRKLKERIYKWARRIGHDEVRQQIIDDPTRRQAYFDRFVESQKVAQTDPWKERVNGVDEREFMPIKPVAIALSDQASIDTPSETSATGAMENTLAAVTDIKDIQPKQRHMRIVQ